MIPTSYCCFNVDWYTKMAVTARLTLNIEHDGENKFKKNNLETSLIPNCARMVIGWFLYKVWYFYMDAIYPR